MPVSIPALLKDLTVFIFRGVQASSKRKCIVPFVLGGCPNLRLEAKDGIPIELELSKVLDILIYQCCHRLLVRPYRLRAIFRPVFYMFLRFVKMVAKEQPAKMTGWGKLQSDIYSHSGGHFESTKNPTVVGVSKKSEEVWRFEVSFRFGSITDIWWI